MRIELRPEPSNPVDRNAIAVLLPNGAHIGYLYASWAEEYGAIVRRLHATGPVFIDGEIERWDGGYGVEFTMMHPDFLKRWTQASPDDRHKVPAKLAVIRLAGTRPDHCQSAILAGLGRANQRQVNLELRPVAITTGKNTGQTRLDAHVDGNLVGHLTPHRADQLPDLFAAASAGAAHLEGVLVRSSSGIHRVEITIEAMY